MLHNILTTLFYPVLRPPHFMKKLMVGILLMLFGLLPVLLSTSLIQVSVSLGLIGVMFAAILFSAKATSGQKLRRDLANPMGYSRMTGFPSRYEWANPMSSNGMILNELKEINAKLDRRNRMEQ